jgi:hypothetical protein
MNKELDANDLRALRSSERETPGGTFDDRKRLEKGARHRYADGRRDRAVTLYAQVNFGMLPADKDRLVRACRAHDLKIADFLRDAVSKALEELEGK